MGETTSIPGSMKAWRVTRHGEPADVLELHDVDVPTPGAGEVLVRVTAVAVNFPDVLLARGEYQERPEMPFIPGIELVGEVVALGPGRDRPRRGGSRRRDEDRRARPVRDGAGGRGASRPRLPR